MKLPFPEFAIRAPQRDYNLRERAAKYGVETMETTELLELLLVSGHRRRRIIQEAVGKVRLREIAGLHAKELEYLFSLTEREALILKLTLEVARRLDVESRQPRTVITLPEDVADLLMPEMRHLDREHLRAVCLDTKNRLIRIAPVSVGTLNSSLAHPRECFKPAVNLGAAAIILVHNHPSGDPTPSREDVQLTKQLMQASTIIGVDLIDHIVIGQGSFVSLRERGLI